MKKLEFLALFLVFGIVATGFALAQDASSGGEGSTPPSSGGGEGYVPPSGSDSSSSGGSYPSYYGEAAPPTSGEGSYPGGEGGAPSTGSGGSYPAGEGGYPAPPVGSEGTFGGGEGGAFIVSSSGGPGGCTTQEECSAYCAANSGADGCGIMGGGAGSGFAIPSTGGPGGCTTQEECSAYCDANEGADGCGVSGDGTQGGYGSYPSGGGASGGMPPGFSGPGGCTTPEECQAYCSANPSECEGGPGGSGGAPSFGGGEPGMGPGEGFDGPREGRRERRERPRRPEGRGPPETIPPEIREAGASQDFLDMMCVMARFNSNKFVSATETAERHFMQLSAEIEIDSTKLQELRERVQVRAEELCSANEANFGSAMKAFMNTMEGPDGMESAMNDIGNQVETQMRAKMEAMQAEMQPKRERMEELRRQIQEIDAMARDVASSGASGEALQVFNQQKQPLYEEMKQLGEEMKLQGEQARAVGSNLETVFGGLGEEMERNFDENSADFTAFKMEMAEKQMALFTKVFDIKMEEVKRQKEKLEADGIDASVFDELIAWAESKKAEAQGVFASGDEQAMEAFMNGMDSSGGEWEAKIDAAISVQIEAKIESKWSELKPTIEEGIALAGENGLDTTQIKTIVAELEQIQVDYKSAQGEQKRELYSKAKDKFEELRAEWEYLRVEIEWAIEQEE